MKFHYALRKRMTLAAGIGALTLCLAAGPAPVLAAAGADDDAAVQLPTVSVSGAAEAEPDGSAKTGYRVKKVQMGPLGEKSAQDTPLAIDTVSADLIKNTGAVSTADALRYVPTVYVNTGASQLTPYYTLRGFSASVWTYNFAVDGMRSYSYYEPLDDKERVEVLHGATGLLYGITNPAGMINYVTKQPTAQKRNEVTVTNTGDQLGGKLAMAGPLSEGSDVSYRFNISYASPASTTIERQTEERKLVSGLVDWKFAKDSRAFFEAGFSEQDIDYGQSLFAWNSGTTNIQYVPKAPKAYKNFGASFAGSDDANTRVGAGFESKLNDVFSLRGRMRYTDVQRSFTMLRQMWTDTALDYKVRQDSSSTFHNLLTQLNTFLDADFATGFLKHKVSMGVTWDDYRGGNPKSLAATSATYASDLYGSITAPAQLAATTGSPSYQSTAYTNLLVTDQIALGPQWDLLLGATHASVDDLNISKNTAGKITRTRYDDSKVTPTLSLSFKPVTYLTTYVTYSQALTQGIVAPTSSTNAGESFAPAVSSQYEAGAKATFGGMSLAAALFRISQAASMTVNNYTTQDGREVHTGAEFTATGKLTDRLTLVGGFTALNAKFTKSSANEGLTPRGVPERMARLYAEYELPWVEGLFVSAGASYTGRVPYNDADTLYVDPVTTFDGGLRYQHDVMGHPLTARLNATNITGENYWTTRSGLLYLGNPRVVSLSLSTEF